MKYLLGKMLLDHYSACILKAKRLKFPYHDNLTPWTGGGAEDVAPYSLTRIKGQVVILRISCTLHVLETFEVRNLTRFPM